MAKRKREEILGIAAFALFCLFFGVLAIIAPNAMDDYTATGLRSGLKALIKALWGRPFGVILVLMGIFAIIGLFSSDEKDGDKK